MEVTATQHGFLGMFLTERPERLRRKWLDPDGRVLCQVAEPFAYHPDAARIQVYRLGDDDGPTFKGDSLNRKVLSVEALRQLEPCWIEPLRSLSPLGLEIARAPHAPPLMEARTFTLPRTNNTALDAYARATGRDVSPILAELVADLLKGRR